MTDMDKWERDVKQSLTELDAKTKGITWLLNGSLAIVLAMCVIAIMYELEG